MTINNPQIGSQNNPTLEPHKIFINKLKKKVVDASKIEGSIIEYHNLFTSYTALLLFYGTGHRPIVDPFCFFNDFDLDNKLLLIDDKATDENNRYRLSALPEKVISQVTEYLKHLKWLTYRLQTSQYKNICNAIENIPNLHIKPSDQELPFLFFLSEENGILKSKSIFEITLKDNLADSWPYAFNQPRNAISTILRDSFYSNNQVDKLTIRNIENQLGHLEQLKHPFGASALISFDEHKNLISSHLESILNLKGFDVIKAKKFAAIRNISKTKWIHSTQPFGAEARETRRKEQKITDASIIREILLDHKEELFHDKESIKRLNDHIISRFSSSPKKINRYLKLFWRFLSIKAVKDKQIVFPPIFYCHSPESSPFKDHTVTSYVDAIHFKKNFLKYLANKGRNTTNELNINTLIAESIISAAAIDNISNRNVLQLLTENELTITTEGSFNYIEIFNIENEFIYRWIPTSLSLGLVNKALNLNDIPSSKKIHEEIEAILITICKKDNKSINGINRLSNLSHAYNVINLPGFLTFSNNTQSPNTHLPPSSFIRLMRNETLQKDESIAKTKHDVLEIPYVHAAINQSPKIYKASNAKLFIKELRKDLNKIKAIVAPKGQSSNKLKRRAYEKLIKKKFHELHNFCYAASVISSWSLKICKISTDKYNKPLAFSTILDYTMLLANSIIYQLYKYKNWREEEIDYELIYEIALESCKHKNKIKLRNCITDFHSFLVKNSIADPVDYDFLSRFSLGTDNDNVDANFISVKEYKASLLMIYEASKQAPLQTKFYTQCCAILILGYRFGVRVSEALHLEYDDIQADIDFNFIVIHIKNNRFKDTKSLAGQRQIPLLGALSSIEKEVLSNTLTRDKLDDERINIFETADDRDSLIDYSSVNIVIKKVLSYITGDETIRYHHLRHSYANRILALLLNNGSFFPANFAKNINQYLYVTQKVALHLLTGQSELNNKSFIAITLLLGHADISTTLNSYLHMMDITHSSWNKTDVFLNKYCNKLDADFITTYCSALKINYVRRQRARAGIKSHEIQKSLTYFMKNKHFKQSTIITKPIPIKNILLNDESLVDITPSLIEIDTILILSKLSNSLSTQQIASRLFISQKSVLLTLERYKKIEIESLYQTYADIQPEGSISRTNVTKLLKETKRIRSHLKTSPFEENKLVEQDIKHLKAGSKEWLSNYQKKVQNPGLILSNGKAAISFIRLLSTLGIHKSLIAAQKSQDAPTPFFKTVGLNNPKLEISNENETLSLDNFITNDKLPHSFSNKRSSDDHRIHFSLNKAYESELKNQKSLDRLIFLATIFANSL